MKKPTQHKKLSLKEILKRHKSNPQDKELHRVIESEGNDDLQEKFNKVLQQSTKQRPFDRKKNLSTKSNIQKDS